MYNCVHVFSFSALQHSYEKLKRLLYYNKLHIYSGSIQLFQEEQSDKLAHQFHVINKIEQMKTCILIQKIISKVTINKSVEEYMIALNMSNNSRNDVLCVVWLQLVQQFWRIDIIIRYLPPTVVFHWRRRGTRALIWTSTSVQ